jgi:hypothetical protein
MTAQELIRTLEAAIDFVKANSVGGLTTRPAAATAATTSAAADDGLREARVTFTARDEKEGKRGTYAIFTVGFMWSGDSERLKATTFDEKLGAKIEALEKGDKVRLRVEKNERGYLNIVALQT